MNNPPPSVRQLNTVNIKEKFDRYYQRLGHVDGKVKLWQDCAKKNRRWRSGVIEITRWWKEVEQNPILQTLFSGDKKRKAFLYKCDHQDQPAAESTPGLHTPRHNFLYSHKREYQTPRLRQTSRHLCRQRRTTWAQGKKEVRTSPRDTTQLSAGVKTLATLFKVTVLFTLGHYGKFLCATQVLSQITWLHLFYTRDTVPLPSLSLGKT